MPATGRGRGQRKNPIWPARAGEVADQGRTPSGRKRPVRYTTALARRICDRLAAGEILYAMCREPGMPTPEGIALWARQKPEFCEALVAARRAGGRPAGTRGPVSTYCPEVAQEIFERLCEGQGMTVIGRDPTMPSTSTIQHWRRRYPEFEEAYQLGKRIQAERMCDESLELAMGATPETAYVTHVKLSHLRWMTGVLAPRQFRVRMVEPDEGPKMTTLLIRRFEIEVDPESGKRKVVAYCPNPYTGQVEREDTPGWERPGGPNMGCLPA
jgi:hypothetical protein